MDDATVVNEVVSRLLAFLSDLKSEGVGVHGQAKMCESNESASCPKKFRISQILLRHEIVCADGKMLSTSSSKATFKSQYSRIGVSSFNFLCDGRENGILVEFRSFLAFIERHRLNNLHNMFVVVVFLHSFHHLENA